MTPGMVDSLPAGPEAPPGKEMCLIVYCPALRFSMTLAGNCPQGMLAICLMVQASMQPEPLPALEADLEVIGPQRVHS